MKTNIKRLLSYTLRFKFSFVISIIGFITFAAADIAAVEWIRRVIQFINDSSAVNHNLIALALVLIAFMRGLGFFIGNYFMSKVGLGVVHDMRKELFEKLIKLPKYYFDSNQSGQLINRITFTTTQVSGATSNAVKTFVREGTLFIGLLIYLFYLNWKLTLLLLVTAPFIALIVNVAGRRLRKIAKSIQTVMGDVTHIASEAVEGNTEIKSFNADSYEKNRFKDANLSNKNQNLKLEATSNLATPIIQVLVSISLAIVAYFALGDQLNINLDSETFVAFFTAAGLMAKPVRQLSSINAIIQKGLAASEEIFQQLDHDEEYDQGKVDSKITGEIIFNDVSFSYDQEKLILNKINLFVNRNDTVALVGKSGSGKTTIANLISKLYSADSGNITIDSVNIEDYKLHHLRNNISIVSQNPTLFNDSIEKNIAYGAQNINHEKVEEAANLSGCIEFIEKLPEGFDTEIGDDGVLLSGGQRQRIAIARAFYKDAPIIILDEATSALDSESEKVVQSAIDKLIKEKTTIVIAHRLSTIENADNIFVIDNGSVVETGTHGELIELDGLYKSLYKNIDSQSVDKSINSDKSTKIIQSVEIDESNYNFLINAWYKKSPWLWLLSPISFVISLLVKNRYNNFIKNRSLRYKPNIPVVIIGNITVGGTGKTPLVKSIASKLINNNIKVGIVSRGYGGKFNTTLEVNNSTTYKQTGDEAQILSKLNKPFFLDKDRARGVKKLIEKYPDTEVILSDDGLQHYNLDRDIEIAVIDGKRRFGNKLLLPAGPLRESRNRLKNVDFIVNNGGPAEDNEYLMSFLPSKFVHLNSGKSYSIDNWPMHNKVHAVAGLGNPNRFYNLLRMMGFEYEKHSFPDHHKFQKKDINFLDHLPIVMSEKDASKCLHFKNPKIWYLTIEATVEDKFFEKLMEKINAKRRNS